jgi:hypothetical protein
MPRRGPIGRKTQITLTDRQYTLLREESERTGLPMTELIRRAVDAVYRPGSLARVRGLEISLGVWPRPDAAVAGRRPKTRLPKRRKRRGRNRGP